MTKIVRDGIKTTQISKQDAYEGTQEIFKPVIDVQKSVKQSIDDKQDKMIEKLRSHYQCFR